MESSSERRPAFLARFVSSYGMLFVLVLLGAYFSVVTWDEQHPTGAAAAEMIAAAFPERTGGGEARVLIAVRESEEDAELARELERILSRRGYTPTVVRGQPADARRALEAAAAAGAPLEAIALSHGTAGWEVFSDLAARFPALAGSRLVTADPYYWPDFLKPDNLLNIANQIAVIAIIAVGMTLVIITGGIDLSAGSLIALSAVVATLLIRDAAGGTEASAGGMALCALAGIALCGGVGAFSGVIATVFAITPFIVTLAMMLVASGLAYILAAGESIYQVPDSFVWLGRGADLLGLPNAVVLMLAIYAAAHVLMSHTTFGRYVYAIGGNAEAARLSGVPVRAVLVSVYTFSGALAGLGGIVMASQLKSGSPTYGLMYELYVIAAVVVGGTSLQGGEGRVLGTLIGAFIIAVIQNGMNLTGVESYTQKIVLGLVILGAVLADRVKRSGWLRAVRRRRAGPGAVVALAAAAIASDAAAQAPAASAGSIFSQETMRAYTASDGLSSDSVLSLAVLDDEVYAGTEAGLCRLRGERWEAVSGPGSGPVPLLAVDRDAPAVLAASDGWIHSVRRDGSRRLLALPLEVAQASSLRGLAARQGRIHLATSFGLFHSEGGAPFARDLGLERSMGERAEILSVAAAGGGDIAAGAASGLFLASGSSWRRLSPRDGARSWAPVDVRAVAFDSAGQLWFACSAGIGQSRTALGWRLLDVTDGSPWASYTALAPGDGAVWLGGGTGAVRLEFGDASAPRWSCRHGRRWLPHDDVRAVALGRDGSAWIATAGGVARLGTRPWTLAAKAAHFEDEIDRRHRRTPYGYVNSVYLPAPGDTSRWQQSDSDNDGLWTAMYGAGECFAWAATRDPAARRRAVQAFEALRFLGTVTQGGARSPPLGFVARSILPASGPDPNAGGADRDREMRAARDRKWKVIEPRWPLSADGKWYWKCDTSSDELDGHYFFHAQFHDLVAETAEEKAAVREVILAITDHLIEHDFSLVDHDGLPTRWARFGPRDLNHDPDWWEERGLNSMSILSYLKVAEHVSGDARYARAARELIEVHGYAQNVLVPKIQSGPGTGNQSDDEMAFMGFYNLLRYETDPALRRIYAYAFSRYFQLELPERNPLFNFLYAAVTRNDRWEDAWGSRDLAAAQDAIGDAVETLVRFPVDRIDWRIEHQRRLDIVALPGETRGAGALAVKRRGHLPDGRVLPIDERHVEHWNHDPWELAQGGDGRTLASGTVFLLPYYLGLHHGFIAGAGAPQPAER